MTTARARNPLRLLAALAISALVVAGCGGDDDGGDASVATTTAAPDAGDGRDDGDGDGDATGRDGGPLARYADYESVNYDDPDRWLCRPDVTDDACDVDLDTTVVEADGTLTVEPFEADDDAPVDCFYVYPTISRDPGVNSDWEPSPDEEGYVVANQAARLREVCRLYAPVYRQQTLTALTARLGGGDEPVDGDAIDPFHDVLDAFRTYMATDNDGRGVVLVGHSQGANMLNRLIATEIDPDPEVRDRLVAAYLAGWNVAVPEGAIVGGDFESVPLCQDRTDTGCVVSWVSFRATDPPPENAYFGRARSGAGAQTPDGMEAACTNPAAVAGGDADLDAHFPAAAGASILSGVDTGADGATWVDPSAGEITTPYVRLPGLLRGSCTSADGFTYLSVSIDADPGDLRADDIGGDLTPEWGLHLVDVNLVMGDIVDLVASQSEAFADR